MFKNILSATDVPGIADAPVLTALEIAQHAGGNLFVLHVLESAAPTDRHRVKHFRTGEEIATSVEYEQEVSAALQQTYADRLKTCRNYKIKVTTGYPFEEILTWAQEIPADLIVVGPHSSRAAEKGVLRVKGKVGSTAEGVIMNERCPAMIVNQNVLHRKLQFKKLLAAVDFSAACSGALRFAIKMSRGYGSRIFVYHMLPVPPSSQYTQAMYAADLDAARNKLKALCQGLPPGIEVEHNLWGGVLPHLEILKYAAQKDVDAIVMGSHTKEKNGKWYVGSAVERVSYRATCPVIVITDPEVFGP